MNMLYAIYGVASFALYTQAHIRRAVIVYSQFIELDSTVGLSISNWH